ncbi:MAG: sigma-E factor negative regulatory protein [Gammaproteobacteria bacterium]|nr:sigma-E factor negative regulatory protein [Gammaproteobacteria bacterium]MDH5801029.1 sigma-E factor negative regulatory protein [Gammaproteobacteria bacterium]
MTKTFEEQFSAFVDGELKDCDHLVDRLHADPELKQRWQRYHLISDAMRHNLPKTLNPDLYLSVSQQLESEPTVLAPRSLPNFVAPLMRKVSGIAIAASVAVATVVSVQMFTTDSTAPQVAEMPDSTEFVRLNPAPSTAATGALPMSPIPANATQYNPQLNKYLVDHNQTVTRSHIQGVMPYARIVVSPSSTQAK